MHCNVMKTMVIIHISTPQLLEKIFSHLDPKDLKTVVLVCKTWNKAAESRATLWSWAKLKHLSQLTLKRLRGAREMAILKPPTDSWHTLLQTALQLMSQPVIVTCGHSAIVTPKQSSNKPVSY